MSILKRASVTIVEFSKFRELFLLMQEYILNKNIINNTEQRILLYRIIYQIEAKIILLCSNNIKKYLNVKNRSIDF